MTADSEFTELISRIRAGDDGAAAELLRTYEPALRSFVRIRLASGSLRRLFDTMDISQSVFSGFFVGAALGRFEVNTRADLLNLLVTMARNKVVDKARRQKGERDKVADKFRIDEQNLPSHDPTASQQVSLRELIQKFREQLTPDERRLADMRADDRPWSEIAAQLKGDADALRMQLSRAVNRIARQLNLEEHLDA